LISKELDKLDTLGETHHEDTSLWAWRYQLEGKLEEIYKKEEIFWQQRENERWLLKGDANIDFFHKCANGRRRKTKICSLDTEQGVISEQVELKQHVVDFYKKLFGSSTQKGAHLETGF
jgi:hypothetical protein